MRSEMKPRRSFLVRHSFNKGGSEGGKKVNCKHERRGRGKIKNQKQVRAIQKQIHRRREVIMAKIHELSLQQVRLQDELKDLQKECKHPNLKLIKESLPFTDYYFCFDCHYKWAKFYC